MITHGKVLVKCDNYDCKNTFESWSYLETLEGLEELLFRDSIDLSKFPLPDGWKNTTKWYQKFLCPSCSDEKNS